MVTVTTLPSIEETGALLEPALLEQAFASFTDAAASLEKSYSLLQQDVVRLRKELEETNQDLAKSLAENQKTRERLHQIVASLPCAVIVVENDETVSLTNSAAQRTFDIEQQEQIPESILTLFQNVPREGCEVELLSGGSRRTSLAVRRANLEDSTGSSVLIAQDISPIKELQKEQECMRRKHVLANMSAMLAHEVRNPLGSLELFAGLLDGSELGSEERRWVRQLQAGLRTLSATVNNVLQFHSAPELGFTRVDLGQLLDWMGQFLAPQAEAAMVALMIEHKLDGVTVMADRHRLEQVLMNLALNAFRFTPAGGAVKISGNQLSQEGDPFVAVQVTDTGRGINPEHRDRVFEPGFTTRPGSAGLGLAVCKAIMEQHRGKLEVLPTGVGAAFQLILRVARSGE